MRTPKQKTIEGRIYEVMPLPAGRAVHVFTVLAKVLAPALGEAATLSDLASEIGKALGTLTERLDPDETERLCRTMADYTRAETEPGSGRFVALKDVYDIHFAGAFWELAQWLAFALEATFLPLPQGLTQRLGGLAASVATAGSRSNSQPISTGPSTVSP